MQRQKPSLSKKVWINTYSIDNYDPVSKELNGKALSNDARKSVYSTEFHAIDYFRKSKLVNALLFAGFPIQWRDRDKPADKLTDKLTLTNFIKDIVGWHQKDASTAEKVFTWIKMPVVLAWNLAAVPFKFLLNLAKVFTEVLPGMGYKACKHAEEDTNNAAAKVGWAALKYFFYGIRYVGRAITSPINNMRYEYKYGRDVKRGGSVIKGIARAVPSALITIAFGVFALPFAIKAAFTLLPLAAGKFSPVIVNALGSAMNAAPSMFSAIGQFLAPVSNFLGVNVHPVISGLCAIAAPAPLIIPTIWTAIKRGATKFINWCMPKAEPVQIVEARAQVPVPVQVQVQEPAPVAVQTQAQKEAEARAQVEVQNNLVLESLIEEATKKLDELKYSDLDPEFINRGSLRNVLQSMKKKYGLDEAVMSNLNPAMHVKLGLSYNNSFVSTDGVSVTRVGSYQPAKSEREITETKQFSPSFSPPK